MAMISERRIKKLKKVLENYPNLLSEFGIKEQIIKALLLCWLCSF